MFTAPLTFVISAGLHIEDALDRALELVGLDDNESVVAFKNRKKK